MSMNGALLMSNQPKSSDTSNATSSPGSAFGATPCDAQDGPMIATSGQEAALASLSARQAKDLGLLTSGTFGRHGSISLSSAALAASLESSLRARVRDSGSTLFKLTWKRVAMPSGRSLCLLRASALHTVGIGRGSWPTPMAGTPAQKGYNEAGNTDSSRRTVARISGKRQTGSNAQTVKIGRLNPEHYRWLMGLQKEWGGCAPTATRSSRRSLKRSLNPT